MEIKERQLMSKKLSKYIASFECFVRCLFVVSVASGSISIASLSTVIGASVGIVSVSFSLAFSSSTWNKKKLLKKRNKKKKHNKIVILARSKSNSIEIKISEALINNEISHEDFMTIVNEEKKCRGLKESIRMMKTQKSGSEKNNLNEEGKYRH